MSVWSDVVFDSGTAEQYANALQDLAAASATLRDVVDDRAEGASRDWTGDARQSFLTQSDTLWGALDDAARDLTDQASEVREELQAAVAEQGARERLRARLRSRMKG